MMRCFRLTTAMGAVALAAMTAGCSDGLEEYTPVPVEVNAMLTGEADTRAGTSLNDKMFSLLTSANGNSTVCLYADDGAYTYTQYKYSITSSSTTSTVLTAPATPPYFGMGKTVSNVYAWYPFNSGNTSFSVNTDQSGNANYDLSDLMLAQPVECTRVANGNNWTVTPAPLTFKHVLSKIILNIKAPAYFKVTAVNLKNVKPTLAISTTKSTSGATNGKVTAIGIGAALGTAGNVKLYSNSTGFTNTTQSMAAVIPPQTINNGFIELTATYTDDGNSYTFNYQVNTEFKSNQRYEYTLTLNRQGISATVNVNDWGTKTGTISTGGDQNL